jgi:hypothetical protein
MGVSNLAFRGAPNDRGERVFPLRDFQALRTESLASRLEFLLFGLQSAVIFLNIFFDLICDPKKF